MSVDVKKGWDDPRIIVCLEGDGRSLLRKKTLLLPEVAPVG